jgi:hypothetical protein
MFAASDRISIVLASAGCWRATSRDGSGFSCKNALIQALLRHTAYIVVFDILD